MSAERAELSCETCDRDTEHELRYAGRLLESVTCSRCGTHTELSSRTLLPAYAHDLELRLLSKPRRMWRRLSSDPVGYVRGLPRAVARQPAKFAREFWALVRR